LDVWSKTWLLRFHPDKCHQLIINRSREEHQAPTRVLPHGEEVMELQQVAHEKDLGIIVDNKLSFESHLNHICNKANRVMGLIRRTFDNLTPKIFKPLYTALVRSHLEYGQAIWSPYTIKDIKKLEAVQLRATKSINGFKDMSYEERLRRLDLPTLKYRRCRGDMIEVFKIL
jgi:hypothetical protein